MKFEMGSGIFASKLLDYVVPFEFTPQGKLFKRQSELEDKRMRFQANLESQRAELQKYLTERNIEANREIALFQARAMRQTQIMVAQENARNVLKDHMIQDALRSFPLNVSPIVLLHNQGRSAEHLLALSQTDKADALSICMAYEETEMWRNRPEPLNIFVTPIHIDSKIENRRVLSDQIWDKVYQRIESFFTRHYSRTSNHPVIFFPTAWSNHATPGLHAAETLHFFLKDLPCIVIEPRFDGSNFRIMVSSWGLGYSSNIHHRTEMSFPVDIDVALATAAYERSRLALAAIEEAESLLDSADTGLLEEKKKLTHNLDLYEALHIEERIKQGRMREIEALGVYKIFNIEPAQDLAAIADNFASQIGLNLALLSDIHHLKSYDAKPLLPSLLKKEFSDLYCLSPMREALFTEYQRVYAGLRREEESYGESRILEIANVKKDLDLANNEQYNYELTTIVKNYMNENFSQTCDSLEENIELAIELMRTSDIPFFQKILNTDEIASNRSLHRRLGARIFALQQSS